MDHAGSAETRYKSAPTREMGCRSIGARSRTSTTSCAPSPRPYATARRSPAQNRTHASSYCQLTCQHCLSHLSGARRRGGLSTRARRLSTAQRHHLLGRLAHKPRAAAQIAARCAQQPQRLTARGGEGTRAPRRTHSRPHILVLVLTAPTPHAFLYSTACADSSPLRAVVGRAPRVHDWQVPSERPVGRMQRVRLLQRRRCH